MYTLFVLIWQNQYTRHCCFDCIRVDMFNGKISRLAVNQKQKTKQRWQTLRFVCQKPDEINSFFPHCAIPCPKYTTSWYLSFSCLCWTVICYGHNIWLIYQIASLLFTFMKTKQTLHERFYVNLDVNST